MPSYQQQFDRVERYFSKFSQINQGIQHTQHSEMYFDDIYTFFMHCYHLKDYLKNDTAYTKHTNKQIEDHISNTPSLALCADICNGLKHFKMSSPPRSGAIPDIDSGTLVMNIIEDMSTGTTGTTIQASVQITHGDTELNAYEVASDAIQSWRDFVQGA